MNSRMQYRIYIHHLSLEKLGNSFLYRGLSYLKLNRNKEACDDFFKAGELGEKEGYDLIKQHCK